MTLYRQHGGAPAPLPFAAYDETGRLWTDLAANEEGRITTGWDRPAPPQPAYDPATQTLAWDAEVEGWRVEALPPPPEPDMPALRADALAKAMAYGNSITARITAGYADAEVLSWDVQEREARAVAAGETLPADALLPGLAADAGRDLASYAAGVVAKAEGFRRIARAAVALRRGAQAALTDEALDTPEKLDAAVTQLRAEADALAADLIGGAG